MHDVIFVSMIYVEMDDQASKTKNVYRPHVDDLWTAARTTFDDLGDMFHVRILVNDRMKQFSMDELVGLIIHECIEATIIVPLALLIIDTIGEELYNKKFKKPLAIVSHFAATHSQYGFWGKDDVLPWEGAEWSSTIHNTNKLL